MRSILREYGRQTRRERAQSETIDILYWDVMAKASRVARLRPLHSQR